MDGAFTLAAVVSYWDVDREKKLTLRGVFKFMQEAAILHADQFDAGARSMDHRRASWVLNRVAASIIRYPAFEEKVRVVTWSSGIRAFKGFRDFRIYCGEELVVAASSLWLHVDLATKSLTRVPKDLADRFPVCAFGVHKPEIDKHGLAPPAPGGNGTRVSLRFSDIDGNGHVNNTAYLDYLQTALAKRGFPPRPREVEIQFIREVPPSVEDVNITLERRDSSAAFRMDGSPELFAHGSVAF
jgi:acyl-ACP thioesterase